MKIPERDETRRNEVKRLIHQAACLIEQEDGDADTEPEKSGLGDDEIRKLVLDISQVRFDEAATDYYLKVLEKETGLENVADYIYNPEEVGMDIDAPVEEITERIFADRK